jgi:hypothetical protein
MNEVLFWLGRMKKYHVALQVITFAGVLMLVSLPSRAFELSGARATDKSVCDKIFTKEGNAISFKETSELIGSGFIVDGKQLRGKGVRCEIKSKKDEGDVTHFIAACASNILLSSVQYTYKAVEDCPSVRGYGRSRDFI